MGIYSLAGPAATAEEEMSAFKGAAIGASECGGRLLVCSFMFGSC